MGKVNFGIGLVGVVVVALANGAPSWAQSDELPRRLRERISSPQVDDGFPSAAAAFDTEVKITASDQVGHARFGASVAISGDTAIVGASRGHGNAAISGVAYVYRRDEGGVNNWGEVTKITASDGANGDGFGRSVSISGHWAIVGAYLDDVNGTRSGSAYVYMRDEDGIDNWGEVTKISASDGADHDWFGRSVAISGDVAIVGAVLDEDFGRFSGSAYVYERNEGGVDNWGEVTKITASDGVGGDQFGISVSISVDSAIVGAYQNDDNGIESGSAYVYRRDEGGVNNWGQVAKIIASDGGNFDAFGFSVAISGDTAIVGAFHNNDNRFSPGWAYVYQRNAGGVDNWGEITKISASDGEGGDKFGYFVAISGNTAIVAAFGDDYFEDYYADRYGSAYVYRRAEGGPNNWGEVTKITPSDQGFDGGFASSVAVSGDTLIAGASGDDDDKFGFDAGSAYVYFTGPPETIGGAIYADCDRRLTSGEDGVEVMVSGPKGVFTAVTSERSGAWKISDVPRGEYTVTPHYMFREYCRVALGGDCPPEPCEASAQITVDAEHRAENLSIQFLGQPACVTNDLNDDGVCTITFDSELFLQCVYDEDCDGADGRDLRCPADCNCDGMATIVFDASCFVRDVYVDGVCGECSDAGAANASGRSGGRTASGFTIGGAVYDDAGDPLLSGIEGVNVQVFGAGRKMVATATTAGPVGIWRVDDLAAGRYHLVVDGQEVISILVNEENEASNLSIRFPRSPKMVRTADPTILSR